MRKRGTGTVARLGLGATSLALLVGCGGDPVAPGGDDLSQAEAAAIAGFMSGAAFEGWSFDEGEGAAASVAPAAGASVSGEPIQFDVAIDASSQCPQGGSVSVAGLFAGTVDSETQTGTVALGIVVTADGCTFPADETVFTVDTNPDLELDGDFAWEAGQPVGDQTFSYAGGIAWTAEDGRSGSCTIDLQVRRGEDGTLVESGSACGMSIDEL